MSRPVTRVAPDATVTEADMVRARIPAGDDATAATRPAVTVGEVMTRDPVSRTPDSDVADVVGEMLDRRLRVVPIVEDGSLVGVLTRRDVLRCVAQRRLTSADVWHDRLDLADRERG